MTGFEIDVQRLLAEEAFVRRLARGLLFDEHRVDDVVQQTWIAALRHPPAQPGALRGWLSAVVRRVVANDVRQHARRARRERAAAEEERPLPSADEVLAREERRRTVVDTLAALPEPYRTAVTLRYLEELEPAEIARRQGVPAATVRTQVRRGLERMREALDARCGGDRAAWCLALVPLARGRDAATAGMATTLVLSGSLAMKKLLFAAAALLCAALAVFAWPRQDVSPVSSSGTATPPGTPLPREVATPDSVRDPAGVPRTELASALAPAAADVFHGGLRGRLVGPAREPLAGAVVHAFGFDGPMLFVGGGGLARVSARTGADGVFELDGLPTRVRCALVADADGDLRQLVPIAATVEPGRVVELGDVALGARAVVTGRVVGPDGAPRAGVEVVAADVPALVFAALPVDRFQPDHGALLVLPRPTSAGRAGDGHDDWTRLRAHLAWALIRDRFEADAEDLVPIVLDGAPLRALWDLLPIERTTTAADGSFRLHGVAVGSNVLAARAPGFASAVRTGLRATVERERDVGTLRLEAGETLSGRVVDARGEPVAGADVRVATVAALGFRGIAPCEPPARAGDDGRFAVGGLARGSACVAARRGPGEPWVAVGPVETGGAVEVALPDTAPLRIALRLPDGIAPAAVRVRARPVPPLGELARIGMVDPMRDLAVSRSDADGIDVGPIAHGVWTLRIDGPGCAPTVRVVEVPTDREVRIALRPSTEVAVEVVTDDDRPCADADVFVVDRADLEAQRVLIGDYGLPQWPLFVPCPPVRTPPSGFVRIALPGGDPVVVARHPLHGVATVQRHEGELGDLRLRLRPAGVLEGRVHAPAAAGVAAAAIRVLVSPAGDQAQDGAPLQDLGACPDPDGSFRVEGLPAGTYDVELRPALPSSLTISSLVPFLQDRTGGLFSDPGRVAKRTVVIEAGEVSRVLFELAGPDAGQGTVRGRAFCAGKPAEGFTVWLREREQDGSSVFDAGWEGRPRAVVDASGGFIVGGLPARRIWLGLRDGGGGAFVHVWEVTVDAGASVTVDADVQLGVLRGVARRPDGGPAPRVPVGILGVGTAELLYFTTESDAEGRFVARDLPVGAYQVTIYERHLRAGPQDVDVLPGTATQPLELACSARYVLEVQVGDAPAVPDGAFYRVHLRHERSTASSSHGTTARSCEFGLQQGGTYHLYLWCGGRSYEAVPSSVDVVEPDTRIEIRPGRQIERIP